VICVTTKEKANVKSCGDGEGKTFSLIAGRRFVSYRFSLPTFHFIFFASFSLARLALI
jgi:hypothetical protein